MKLLLDTHILVWISTGDRRLSPVVRTMLSDVENEWFFSPASIAEISLKHEKHPELVPFDGEAARSAFLSVGCSELPLTSEHCAAIDKMGAHHFDPIDRIILAQAKAEGMKLLSHDRQFPQYGDFVISV